MFVLTGGGESKHAVVARFLKFGRVQFEFEKLYPAVICVGSESLGETEKCQPKATSSVSNKKMNLF